MFLGDWRLIILGAAAGIIASDVLAQQVPASRPLVIVQTRDYARAAAASGPGTLFITDLDKTIFDPAQDLGSDEWFDYYYKKMGSPEYSGQAGSEFLKIIDLYTRIVIASKMVPVQPEIPALLARLQDSGVRVIALTVRNHRLMERTPEQLASLGIDFSRSAPVSGDFTVPVPGPADRWASFHRGILYTDGHGRPKGLVLAKFLEMAAAETGWRPERIVYIDDSQKEVEDLGGTAQALGLGFTGFRYGRDDEKVKNFNPVASDFELACFEKTGRLISNARALKGECPVEK